MFSRKSIVRIVSVAGLIFLVYAIFYAWQVVAIGAAYKAKVICSGVFISKRSVQDIMRGDLESVMEKIHVEVDFKNKSVTTSFPGVPRQQAIYRDQLGCTVLVDASDAGLLRQSGKQSVNTVTSSARPGKPSGSKGYTGHFYPEVPLAALAIVLDEAFSEKDPDNPIKTRAVVIVHDGRIIAERYAPGISADTALPGWSMAKSVTTALVGILVRRGKLSVDQPVPIVEWSADGDSRKAITMDHLLHMSSGLDSDERSGPVVSDVNRMLLRSRDAAAYAVARPLRYEPGSYWHYSSGTTNIISRIIRDRVGGTVADYHVFPRKALFDRIGMTSAVMEVDAAGTFVASSFMYATARDWARFGQLYLQDGVWDGEQILPSGWVSYSATPTKTAPRGQYGAHFWTNGGTGIANTARQFPRLPADLFYASGYEGQNVVVIPSRNLVIVRLGMTKKFKAWDMESFIADILMALATDGRGTGS